MSIEKGNASGGLVGGGLGLRSDSGLGLGLGLNNMPSSGPVNALAQLAGKVEVRGLYFNAQTVYLDGYKFVGCRFDNCLLKLSSGNFEMIRCVLDPSTRVEYAAGLQKVVQLFTGRFPWAHTGQYFPQGFVSTKHPDGTESIHDGVF
jgi:hypothetical protein